jgi:hypothetical protein
MALVKSQREPTEILPRPSKAQGFQMKTGNQEIGKSVQRAEAALSARTELLALGRDMESRQKQVAKVIDSSPAAIAHADTQAAIGPVEERPAWIARAEAEVIKSNEAQRELQRIAAWLAHLPTLQEAADDEIMASYEELLEVVAGICREARSHMEEKVRGVAAQLGQRMQQAHALAAAGVSMGSLLTQTSIANPSRNAPFITATTMMLDQEMILLNKTWRESPESMALFEAYAPHFRLKSQMEQHVRRIKDYQSRALEDANRLARLRSFDPQLSRAPVITPLTPAEMEPIWLEASGGIPLSAADPGLVELASTYAPSRAKSLIEYEARQAAGKFKQDSDPGVKRGWTMGPKTTVTDATVRVDITGDDFGRSLTPA